MITLRTRNRFKPISNVQLDYNNPLSRGLVCCYTFTGFGTTAYDKTYYRNHGAITGAKWVLTNRGPALSFATGSSDRIDGSALLGDIDTGSVSIVTQLKLGEDWDTSHSEQRIFSFWDDSSGNDISAYNIANLPTLRFAIGWPPTNCEYDGPFYEGQEYHFVFTFNAATGGLVTYVNGAQVATGSGGSRTTPYATQSWIGNQKNFSQPFNGIMDHFLVYNRALSPAEARQHANDPWQIFRSTTRRFRVSKPTTAVPVKIPKEWGATKPPLGAQIDWGNSLTQGLVGFWAMNEAAGKICYNAAYPLAPDLTFATAGSLGGWSFLPTLGSATLYSSGASNYLDGGDDSRLEFASGQSFSYGAWFYPTSSVPTRGLITKGYRDSGENAVPWYLLRWGATTGAVDAYLRNTSSGNFPTPAVSCALNAWHLAIAVYDSVTATHSIFVNGIYRGQATSVGADAYGTNTGAFAIGRHDATTFGGSIGCAFVFKRALRADEISALYLNTWQIFQSKSYYLPLSKPTTAVPVKIPKEWGATKPPLGVQINRGHRLAPDFAILLNERAGNPFDSYGDVGVRTTGADWKGKYIFFDGTNDAVIFSNDSGRLTEITGLTTNFSVVVKGKFPASWSGTRGIVSVVDGTDKGWGIYYSVNSNQVSFPKWSGSGTFPAQHYFVANEEFSLCGVCTTNAEKLYKNGVAGISDGDQSIVTSTETKLSLGRIYSGSSDFSANINIEYVLVYKRALKQIEAKTLYEDPYCFIQPSWGYFAYPVDQTAEAAGDTPVSPALAQILMEGAAGHMDLGIPVPVMRRL